MLICNPELPSWLNQKQNTPTTSPTATIALTPTKTLDPEYQCNFSSPEVILITATLGATNTPMPFPSAIERATIAFTPTATLPPTRTPTPTESLTPTASAASTPTHIIYTVQLNDTLGGIALRFG